MFVKISRMEYGEIGLLLKKIFYFGELNYFFGRGINF